MLLPVRVAEASLNPCVYHGVSCVGEHGVLVLVALVVVLAAEGPVLMVWKMVQIALTTMTCHHFQ